MCGNDIVVIDGPTQLLEHPRMLERRRGMRGQGFQQGRVGRRETAVVLVQNLGDADHLTGAIAQGGAQDVARAVARFLVDLNVPVSVLFDVLLLLRLAHVDESLTDLLRLGDHGELGFSQLLGRSDAFRLTLDLFAEDGFAAKYLDMLRAGGTLRHKELLAPFGLDATDPAFWQKGLAVIGDFVDELEAMEG